MTGILVIVVIVLPSFLPVALCWRRRPRSHARLVKRRCPRAPKAPQLVDLALQLALLQLDGFDLLLKLVGDGLLFGFEKVFEVDLGRDTHAFIYKYIPILYSFSLLSSPTFSLRSLSCSDRSPPTISRRLDRSLRSSALCVCSSSISLRSLFIMYSCSASRRCSRSTCGERNKDKQR